MNQAWDNALWFGEMFALSKPLLSHDTQLFVMSKIISSLNLVQLSETWCGGGDSVWAHNMFAAVEE